MGGGGVGSRWAGSRRGYGLVGALALIVATITHVHAGSTSISVAKIKGIRWVDGVQEKVRCSKGHALELASGQRTLTLAASDPKCPIAADALSLVFEGTEDVVVSGGKVRRLRALVAIETQTASIDGTVSSLLSLGRDGSPKKDKGTIAYLIDDGGPVVMFLGSYTANKF